MTNTSHEVAKGPHHESGAAPSALSAHSIVKRCPGVLANDSVDFDVLPGEVHTLLGENGAGKSTFINILAGLVKKTSGTARIWDLDIDQAPRLLPENGAASRP